jgi:small redox-active disulfide protein 2
MIMKDIKVLGPVCPKCEELLKQTQQAVRELNLACTVEKVSDIQKITSYGVMMTPALVVDGAIKVSGKVPSVEQIKDLVS